MLVAVVLVAVAILTVGTCRSAAARIGARRVRSRADEQRDLDEALQFLAALRCDDQRRVDVRRVRRALQLGRIQARVNRRQPHDPVP